MTQQLQLQPDPFRAGAYNFQSISAMGEKAIWPHEIINAGN